MSALFVKICGITSGEALAAAADCGADAVGFVFAPSPRQLTPLQAAELCAQAPAGLLRVAVTRHPTQALVDEIALRVRPHWLQTDIEDLARLTLPPGIEVLPVVRGAVPAPMPTRILFEGPRSGQGETGDWDHAAQLAARTQLILAGGLSAVNVAQAIARVRPFGVDVSSGVENAPGRKDPQRIREFIEAARQAGARPGAVRTPPMSAGLSGSR